MSIQAAPKYKPTDTYLSTALRLSEARIDELAGLATIKNQTEYDDWHLDKTHEQNTVIDDIALITKCNKYNKSKVKINYLKIKCIIITNYIQDKSSRALYQRVSEYTESVNQHSDSQLKKSCKKIRKTIGDFREEIENFETRVSTKTMLHLSNAELRLASCEETTDKRFDDLNYTDKSCYFPSTPTYCSVAIEQPAPAHRPSRNYCLAKAEYRKAYIEELGVCLNYQKNPQKYASWFQNQLAKQVKRIDTLESFAAHYRRHIGKDIAECRMVLKKVEDQFSKKMAAYQITGTGFSSSEPCRRLVIVL